MDSPSPADPGTYRVPQDDICIARARDDIRCTDPRVEGSLYCGRHAPSDPIPAPVDPANPVAEGLAVVVMTGAPGIQLLACAECGVLLWDVERHWRDAHSNRLHALRAIRAREG